MGGLCTVGPPSSVPKSEKAPHILVRRRPRKSKSYQETPKGQNGYRIERKLQAWSDTAWEKVQLVQKRFGRAGKNTKMFWEVPEKAHKQSKMCRNCLRAAPTELWEIPQKKLRTHGWGTQRQWRMVCGVTLATL